MTSPAARGLVPAVRALLAAFAVLTLVATNQLFVRAADTASGFAWTITPPLTAALFGGGYGAGCVLVVLSLRGGTWARARVGFVTVLLFVVLVLASTLLHLEKFHFGADGTVARLAAWVWLVVYVVVPVAMAVALRAQLRAPGAEPPRGPRLGAGLRLALAAQALVLVVVGTALFLLDGTRALWPWPLTELTARAVASWLVALGVGAALAVAEDDVERLEPAAVTYAVLGVLQLAAVVRFSGSLDGGAVATWVYLVALLSVLAVGATGVLQARAARRALTGVAP